MFCTQCGFDNRKDARFCQKCGNTLEQPIQQQGDSAPALSASSDITIWNPNAASNWSLIFTPAFGSYIHMLNWRTLDKPQKAASARIWFYFSLAMFVMYFLIGLFIADAKIVDGAVRGFSFLYLIVWYFSAGRSQTKYVKAKFGSSYQRRGWGKPLLIGFGVVIACTMLALIVGMDIGNIFNYDP